MSKLSKHHPHLFRRHRRNDRAAEMEKSLRTIYAEGNGRLPDLGTLERGQRNRWPWIFFGFVSLVVVVGLAAWAGFFLLQPLREFRGSGLQLTIQGPERITLGREETYTIVWSNKDKHALTEADVRLGLPPDFVVASFDPKPTDASLPIWKLGLVPVAGHGSITVRGVFTGALDTQSALQAIGNYRPSGFPRDFEFLATQAITYQDSVLKGAVELPPKVLSGDVIPITYHVVNQGKQTLSGLMTHVHLPSGFVVSAATSSVVTVLTHDLFLPLEPLAPGASSTVSISGSFTSDVSGEETFLLETGHRDARGGFVVAERTEGRVPVVAGDLSIRLVANGSDTDHTIGQQEPLRVTLGYQNTSPERLKGVTLTLGFETIVDGRSATGTSLLDWSKLDDATQGASTTKARVQTLRYGKKQLPALLDFEPQAEGTIELTLPTLPAASGTKDALIRITVEGEVFGVGGTNVHRLVHAQPINLHYRSDADVQAEARYFTEEGAPVGFGPLPPVALKTTAYQMTWHLHKTLHALEGLVVSAQLPKIVAWSARTTADAGSVSYDASTRTVRWNVDQIPKETKDLEAHFEIQLTPSAFDIGRFADLLGETKWQAQDPIVNEALSKVKPPLTTDLQNDEGAKGKGVVRKE